MVRVCRSCCGPAAPCGLIVATVNCGGGVAGAVAGASVTIGSLGTSSTVKGVSALGLISGGSLYQATPTLTIAPPASGTTATGVAILGTLAVRSPFTLTSAGSGYTFEPAVTISGGGGSGATASARHVAAAIASAIIDNPGAGYTDGIDYLANLGSGFGTVNMRFDVVSGSVTNLHVVSGGANFTIWPTIDFSNADGGFVTTTAVGRAGLAAGALTAPILGAGGSGYTSNPTVTIAPPPSGTTATATVKAGATVTVRMTSTGDGYTSTPAVTIGAPQAGGVQATASATVTGVVAVPYTAAGTYAVSGSRAGLTITSGSTGAIACDGLNHVVNLTTVAAAGYSCARTGCCVPADQPTGPPYPNPSYPSTLTMTDPFGAVTLSFTGTAAVPKWEAHANRTAANASTNCTGTSAPVTNVPVPVYFAIYCAGSASNTWYVVATPNVCGSSPGVPRDDYVGPPAGSGAGGFGITASPFAIGSCLAPAGTYTLDPATFHDSGNLLQTNAWKQVYGSSAIAVTVGP